MILDEYYHITASQEDQENKEIKHTITKLKELKQESENKREPNLGTNLNRLIKKDCKIIASPTWRTKVHSSALNHSYFLSSHLSNLASSNSPKIFKLRFQHHSRLEVC